MKILSRYFRFILTIFLVLQGLILFTYPIFAFNYENDNVSFDNNYSEVMVSDSDDSDITQTGEENDNLASFSETESYSLSSVYMESSDEFESITDEIMTNEDVYDINSKKDYVQSHYDTSTLLDGNDDSGKEFITYYNDFIDVIENGGEFTLTSDLVLTKPIIIEQDVVISGDYKINFSFSNVEPYLIKILANGSLTLNNVTIDGSNLEIATKDFCAVEILGDLTLNNANIMNFNISSSNGMQHLIFVNGGNFEMNKGKISNNNLYDGRYHGVIGLENGATFLLDGGIISNNYVYDPQGASGIIYVSNTGDNNIFTMKDGDIFENKSCAVFVGSLKSDNFSKAQMIFDGGSIRSNHYGESYYAGGIYVNNGEVIMNNGTIEGNTGQFYGGGFQ